MLNLYVLKRTYTLYSDTLVMLTWRRMDMSFEDVQANLFRRFLILLCSTLAPSQTQTITSFLSSTRKQNRPLRTVYVFTTLRASLSPLPILLLKPSFTCSCEKNKRTCKTSFISNIWQPGCIADIEQDSKSQKRASEVIGFSHRVAEGSNPG